MTDQSDLHEVQTQIRDQADWGQPRWYSISLRLARLVISTRARVAALEDRVAALEQRPPP